MVGKGQDSPSGQPEDPAAAEHHGPGRSESVPLSEQQTYSRQEESNSLDPAPNTHNKDEFAGAIANTPLFQP